jgi:hypothetical protein
MGQALVAGKLNAWKSRRHGFMEWLGGGFVQKSEACGIGSMTLLYEEHGENKRKKKV